MQHINSFTQNKCQKKITIEYAPAEGPSEKILTRNIQNIKRLKGKKIVICVTDHDFIEDLVNKKKKAGEKDIEFITLQRYYGALQQTMCSRSNYEEQIFNNFKSGKIRTLFILGNPYWDEVKDLEGIADTSIWINRNLSCKDHIEGLYYTIALAAEDTRCLVSTVIF
jgi:hypothetical protein